MEKYNLVTILLLVMIWVSVFGVVDNFIEYVVNDIWVKITFYALIGIISICLLKYHYKFDNEELA